MLINVYLPSVASSCTPSTSKHLLLSLCLLAMVYLQVVMQLEKSNIINIQY